MSSGIRLPMAGNLRRFWVTNDIIFGYHSARSGEAWKQAITSKFDWQYWGIKPHTSGVLKQYQPTKLTHWSKVSTCIIVSLPFIYRVINFIIKVPIHSIQVWTKSKGFNKLLRPFNFYTRLHWNITSNYAQWYPTYANRHLLILETMVILLYRVHSLKQTGQFAWSECAIM